MATAVLANEVSKIGSETHVGNGSLAGSPFLDWESLEEDESLAINDILSQDFEEAGELGKSEVVL